MAGIYIHIPFCSKACHYCNFHFSTSLHRKNEFVEALLRELDMLQFPGEQPIDRQADTIYFGGGTPSLLNQQELDTILEKIHQRFSVSANAELTLEANPDDLKPDKIRELVSMGINRLSIGVQSFFDEDLRWMNRAHHANQARRAIADAQDAGITNLSIDLIYGVPGMSTARWQQNIETAVSLQVPHLSCYALTVEEKTALHHFIRKGKVQPPSDSLQAEQFLLLMDLLATQRYEHYEISNFALPGMRSRHNSSYWQGKPYYGFGPSAHSFNGAFTRWWNIPNNALYISQLMAGQPAFESEQLSPVMRINETIMTLLRTIEGLPLDSTLPQIAGIDAHTDAWQEFAGTAHEFIKKEWLVMQNNHLVLTTTGKLYADHIASSLFLEE